MKLLLLSHFNPFYGPIKSVMVPNVINSKEDSPLSSIIMQIPSYMDMNRRNQLFQVFIQDYNLSILNLVFEINSKWARGTTEILMISILFDGFDNLCDKFGNMLISFKEKMQNLQDAYKGFYSSNLMKLKTNPEIKLINKQLIEECNELYKII